jgi:adenine-specific DNA-methyltransferase
MKPANVRKEPTGSELKDAVATADALFSLGLREAQLIASEWPAARRTGFASSLCASVLQDVWKRRQRTSGHNWELRKCPSPSLEKYSGLTERLGQAFSVLPPAQAGFLLGQLYTALLPCALRKSLGAYYTPPSLVNRLLELVTSSGFDWSSGRIIDPACGGAAFLASVAPKLVEHSRHRQPLALLEDVERRLVGVELDPFAAWMSMVLLELALLDLTILANRPLKNLVMSRDALEIEANELGLFDLVIGNPPYRKLTLPSSQRSRFEASLFGHANLYGLFTDLAVRLTKAGGVIGYVTPTSFLGGEYFKNLRRLLASHAPLQRLDFVSDRDGVFDGVLQETMLAVFERKTPATTSSVELNLLRSDDRSEELSIERIGSANLNNNIGGPWLLPRSAEQTALIDMLNSMPHRLKDYGFVVATGQLVWNRHKDQLRKSRDKDCYPIIWAEAVNADGKFHFQAARRSHLPYFKIKSGQGFLINREPCILVQRTTAKEQKRRIIAAVVPNSFVLEYPGFVVENHLNMIYSTERRPQMALRTLSILLNSAVFDKAFRCINGSVAVSAYELNCLALPNPGQMRSLQEHLASCPSSSETEQMIASLYSRNGHTDTIAIRHTRSHNRKMAA